MRMEPEFKEKLKDAVRAGKAPNVSELIRVALQEFLEEN
jgi:Arc/MetJ-type ribon-helix-helix transcriptional regulator